MKIGEKIYISNLTDGIMKVDGGFVYGPVPKMVWESYTKPDRRNRVPQSATALLIRAAGRTLLIDAGVGSKRLPEMRADFGFTRSRLPRELRQIGVNARNVDLVAYSNLKFYRSGGGTKLDRDSAAVPTFRNAEYLMQKSALEAAKNPGYRFRDAFDEDDYGPLEERDMVRFVKDGVPIMPGVTPKLMEGVAKGNQVFYIQYGCERMIYAGDVIPTRFHLDLDHIQADADDPNKLMMEKQSLIREAVEDGWLLIFGRAPECPAAYLEMRNGALKIRPRSI